MKYATAALLIGLAVAWVAVAHSEPAPRPSIVSATWELQFKYQAPKQLTLTLPGRKKPRTFWYMLFTVKNRSGADQNFVPEFDLYTDTGEVLPSVGGPSVVFIEIQKLQAELTAENAIASVGKLQGDQLQGSLDILKDEITGVEQQILTSKDEGEDLYSTFRDRVSG